MLAAAFGRLCVETILSSGIPLTKSAAAFGRLCVETDMHIWAINIIVQPPSGGCVLKLSETLWIILNFLSRLRAAVC